MAIAAAQTSRVDPMLAFRARCEARAHLYGVGELDLHDAVDALQAAAVAYGLVASIGQDAVQAIMADALRPVREREWAAGDDCPEPPVRPAPPVYDDFGLWQGWDSPMPDPVSSKPASPTSKHDAFLEAYRKAWEEHHIADCSLGAMQAVVDASRRRRGTPRSTVDALFYSLRRGLSCLNDQACRERLAQCDEQAVRTVAAELMKWPGQTEDGKPRTWLPAWKAEDVGKLVDAWNAVRGAS
jgi:hypothetical protein